MVFESIVAYFLDKYLSNYLDNFDSSKLKIGIWNGDVVLENLYVKTNALDELDLPIRVVLGHLKELKLKIPWKSLYTESVKATIDGLTILVAPKSSGSYDADREKKEQRDRKLGEVKRLLELEKSKTQQQQGQEEAADSSSGGDTFTERIQMQVIRNLELTIKNIHVRYEDDFSKPEHPFAAGFTLDSIEIRTTDENWIPTFLKENTQFINKLASLNSLAVYCDSDVSLMNKQSKDIVIPKLQRMIRESTDGINHILSPMSLKTKALLNMKRGNFSRPMFDFAIFLESIGLNLNRLQYFDLVDMLNTIDLMALNAKYKKYRPAVALTDSKKAWWKFAYNSIVQTQIRPKREQFTWEHIKLVTKTRREYVQLLKRKLKSSKMTPGDLELEKKCQEVLDVFNLVLANKQADVEVARVEKERQESSKGSWWGWMSRSSSSSSIGSESSEDSEKIQEAVKLSVEEKSKLYQAIGYTGEESYSQYPEDFVNMKVTFSLNKFEIKLIDGEYKSSERPTYISKSSLIHLVVNNMEMNFYQYPVLKGIKVDASVKSIRLSGSRFNTINHDSSLSNTNYGNNDPILIEPHAPDHKFLEFCFETNPIDKLCNKRFVLKSKGLRITYHAMTINNIVYFFRSSETAKQKKIKSAAIKTINQVKERSYMFMKNNLQNIQYMDLNIDIEPSYLIMPQNGEFNEQVKLICVNFGHLSFKSEPKNLNLKAIEAEEDEAEEFESASEGEDDEKLDDAKSLKRRKLTKQDRLESNLSNSQDVIEASYLKFQIMLKQTQILLVQNFDELAKINSSVDGDKVELYDKYYLLSPLDFVFNIHQCVYIDDVKLPAWKLFGTLPLVEFNLTDTKLENIIELVLSVPFPKSARESNQTIKHETLEELLYSDQVDESTESDSIIDTISEMKSSDQADSSTPNKALSKSPYLTSENLQQSISLEFSFEIKEINLKLKEENAEYFDWILFKISSFGVIVQAKTYDMNAHIYLNRISCEYGLFNDVDNSRLFLINSMRGNTSGCNLVDIQITKTDPDSPTLTELHQSRLLNIDLKLTLIDIVLNLNVVKNMMEFAKQFEKSINKIKYIEYEKDIEQFNKNASQRKGHTSSNSPLLSDTQIAQLIGHKNKTSLVKNELFDLDHIDMKLNAKFDGLRVRLSTVEKNYFELNINSLDVELFDKPVERTIEVVLSSISVIDLQSSVPYRNILSLKESSQDLITIRVKFNEAPRTPLTSSSILAAQYQKEKYYFKNYLDEEHFDLDIDASISKLQFVFLYKNLNTIMDLLNILDDKSSKETVQQNNKSSQELVETKTVSDKESSSSYSFLYRIKLDVKIDAPIIIVPESVTSMSALLLDCGLITIRTSQIVRNSYYQGKESSERSFNDRIKLPPVIEVQRVTLSNMEISRVMLKDDLKVTKQLFLVDCSDLKVTVMRNLQPNVFADIEPITVEVIYGGLLVSISQSDYSFIINLLQSFGQKTGEPASSPKRPKLQAQSNASETAAKIQPKADTVVSTEYPDVASMVVRVFIQSIQMHLHKDTDDSCFNSITDDKKKREDVDAFSRMELNNLQLELGMFKDTDNERNKMKMQFLLDSIILSDNRVAELNKKPIRLIEKYKAKNAVQNKPMISVAFDSMMTRADEDDETALEFIPYKKINTSIDFLRLRVNVDYLILLYDFFIEGLPRQNVGEEMPISPISPGKDQFSFNPDTVESQAQAGTEQRFFCDVHIRNPQIILYENQFEPQKSNMIIIDGLIDLKVVIQNRKTKLQASLSDFMIQMRSVKAKRVLKRSKHIILQPTAFGLSGVIEEPSKRAINSIDDFEPQKQSFILDLQDIGLTLSPQMLNTSLKMLTSIQNSISQRFQVQEIDKRVETQLELKSLFQTVPFTSDNFWFFSSRFDPKRDGSMDDMSLVSSQSGGGLSSDASSSRAPKSQLMIRTSQIQIKLEAGVAEKVPLICLNVSVAGEMTNWTFKPCLSLSVNIELAYFDELLSVWQPIIEPVELKTDQFKSYELLLDMVTNDVDIKRKNVSNQITEHLLGTTKPLKTFIMQSKVPLQLVVTKTFLNMLETVTKSLKIEDDTHTSVDKDDYEMYEIEEDMLIEKFRNNLVKEEILLDSDMSDMSDDDYEENPSFNFLIKNELGFDVSLQAQLGFKFQNVDLIDSEKRRDIAIDQVVLRDNAYCPITTQNQFNNHAYSFSKIGHAASLEESEKDKKTLKFKLDVLGDKYEPVLINVDQTFRYGYPLARRNPVPSKAIKEPVIICEMANKFDKKRIYLRSSVQIINTLDFGVSISYAEETEAEAYTYKVIKWGETVIAPGKKWHLPMQALSEGLSDYVKIAPVLSNDSSVVLDKQIVNWNSLVVNKLLDFDGKYFIQALVEKEPVNILNETGIHNIDFEYNIVLLPTVTFYNYLPYPIVYQVTNGETSSWPKSTLHPGESTKLPNAKIGSSSLILEMENYANSKWYASQLIEFDESSSSKIKTQEMNLIEFRSAETKIVSLAYNTTMENHSLVFTLYAPYWILNQTTKIIQYRIKGSDNEMHEIDNTMTDSPQFLKINCKIFANQKKAMSLRVRLDESDGVNVPGEWGESFFIDAVGNNGTVVSKCKENEKNYEIGVDIQLSSSGLTKIIKLSPYYLLVNNTSHFLNIKEITTNNQLSQHEINLEPNAVVPFWPTNYSAKHKNCLSVRPLASNKELDSNIPFSVPFWYNIKHTTALTFKNNPCTVALTAECSPTERIVRTVFKPYDYGMAPVLILNSLSNLPVVIKQNEPGDDDTFIMPQQYFTKTWKNPIGKRELVWSCGTSTNQIFNLETIQQTQPFNISPTRIGFVLSFLDGLQRVLLFVDRLENVNEEATGFKEIKGMEYILDLNSLSMSLVDDVNQLEILYASITSSTISWGEKLPNKTKAFKPFPNAKIDRLELAYQKFLQNRDTGSQGLTRTSSFVSHSSISTATEPSYKTVTLDDGDEVDFERMVLFVGKKEVSIERQYAPSLYVNYFASPSQTNLHLMIHKLQIDNQLYESVFPVLFSKVLPPKTVAYTTTKPIIEMCMVQSHCQRTKTTEMKYFKVLMQEFSVKVDIILLNTLIRFLTDKTKSRQVYVHDSNEFFKEMHEIKSSFKDMFKTIDNTLSTQSHHDTPPNKIYFDSCHISPIKMHLSFSLSGQVFKDFNFLLDNPFFKSIGLALTDMQDVVFKLGFFQVKNSVYSWNDLSNEIAAHYKSQVIKQAYILLLGLDMLGNPFGLIRGLAEGVESLFYEPYAGLVQGPGEFAEGVALGVTKLFGNTVGGAAGAVSKITGTLGKGLATLSMDTEYQKARLKNVDNKQTFLQNVSQNLVMGVVSGVTGIVEKPMEGAKSDGALGFFSGLGKGILGAVTKPSAGIIDFASQSLDGIKKVAIQEESVDRARPPRAIYSDRIVRPYRIREAHAIFLLKGLDKSVYKNDQYITSLDTSTNPKQVLILTSRQLLLIKENYAFGAQKVEWSCELGQLIGHPRYVNQKIFFMIKTAEKKFFSGKNYVEESADVKDKATADRFITKVIQLWENITKTP